MITGLGHKRRRFAGLLLVALLFRAYVPVGFMPAAGSPFLLELCPAAAPMPMSMPMPMGHHHAPAHLHVDDCPFGSASAAGPVSHLIVFEAAGRVRSFAVVPVESSRLTLRALRAHQPRGPPAHA